ncbi:MAG: hypothetical protein LH480_13185 [Rubrivivax sp.]|nr:hypothetical protein [Rubrivivax sp.]
MKTSAIAPTSAPAATPASAPGGHEALRGKLMAASLGALLDRARGAREVLPHLAALERGLIDRGAGAVTKVPVQWLARIVSQLASLPLPDDDPPLHDLLQRLMDRLHAHGSTQTAAVSVRAPATAVADARNRDREHVREQPPECKRERKHEHEHDHDHDHESDYERTLVIREISHSEFAAAENELLPTTIEPRL